MIVKNLYLTKNEPIFFEAAQGAAGVQFGIRVQDYTIPEGAVINIYVSKPDGTLIYNAAEVSGNTITVTTTTQMTAVVGRSNCQVQILSTGILLRTFVFALQVKPSIIDESAIESTDEFGALETALQTVSQYDADIEALQDAVTDINGQIGSFQYVNITIPYTANQTCFDVIKRAYEASALPKGKAFIATINSGSVYTAIGHWYENTDYGYCIIQNFASANYVRLDNGTWVDTEIGRTRTSSVDIKIGSGSTYTGTITRYGKVRIYNFYYEMSSPVGTIVLTDPIGTLSADDKPYAEETGAIVGLTSSAWSSATIYSMAVMVTNTGQIFMRGNPTQIALCNVFRGQIVWSVSQ